MVHEKITKQKLQTAIINIFKKQLVNKKKYFELKSSE